MLPFGDGTGTQPLRVPPLRSVAAQQQLLKRVVALPGPPETQEGGLRTEVTPLDEVNYVHDHHDHPRKTVVLIALVLGSCCSARRSDKVPVSLLVESRRALPGCFDPEMTEIPAGYGGCMAGIRDRPIIQEAHFPKGWVSSVDEAHPCESEIIGKGRRAQKDPKPHEHTRNQLPAHNCVPHFLGGSARRAVT